MANIKTYSDHSYDVLMGDKHRIIKSILRQLFNGIYIEIEMNCYFDQDNKDLISDFINWPDDAQWDFNATAGMFNSWLFKNKTLDRVTKQENNGLSFSIGNIESKIQSSKYKIKLVEHRRLKKQLEVKKNFSFGFKKMTEIGAICVELIRMRNLAAHNNGLNNPLQALILISNILRLLDMTPDVIRESTMQHEYLENFLKKEFLDSVLGLQRPDIEDDLEELKQKLTEKNKNNKESHQRDLNDKLEEISEQLTDLKDLKNISNNLSDNQISVNEILSLVKQSRLIDIKKVLKKDNKKASQELDIELDLINNNLNSEESLSRSEVYGRLMELRLKIKKEINVNFIGFRKEHNLLDEPMANAILNERLATIKDLKSNSTFQMKLKINKNSNKEPSAKLDVKNSSNKTYMDVQIDKYWPKVQQILEEYFKES